MNRRNFLATASATGAFLFLKSCKADLLEQVADTALDKRGAANVTRNSLKLPAEVNPVNLSLTASPTSMNLGSTTVNNALAYNGSFPAPTIRTTKGSNATITFNNNLGEDSITHWHGLLVNHMNDGHPMSAVSSGNSYSYNFPVIQRAGMNWYHPHPHMRTGYQVYHGLAGAFIINDTEEAAFNLPTGEFEVPLIIRDCSLTKSGDLHYQPKSGGFLGNLPMVNGTLDPYLNVKRAVYRFRILNGANSRIFDLNMHNGLQMILIGNDGGLLPSSSTESILTISNGERLDVLVDFRSFPENASIMLRDARTGWSLLEFRVTGSNVITYSGSLTTSSTIPSLGTPLTTRIFNFQGMNKINGQVYDHHRIDFNVPFNQTEKWTFTTAGNAPHPVHVHGASFQVIDRRGGRNTLYPWEAGWKDTVLLENNETVDVLIKFEAYKGIYLLHCHKLEHEDMGMMSNFEVI
jgi:blue copper oxidase